MARGKRARRRLMLLLASSALCGSAIAAPDSAPPRNNFGSPGLIEMPSARFAPDGELSASASFFKNTQRYSLGFQILPWLEGSFRYSGLENYNLSYPVYYDRSFELKARLWDETEIWPAVAIGVNDLVGTGVYGAEYIVATKSFGNIDATLGVGWGRLGTANSFRNPLSLLSDSFDTRGAIVDTGNTSFNTFFRGAASIFGGAVWHTPVEGLSLIAEYSSDGYITERTTGNFVPRNQFNFGASYHATDSLTLGVSWLYGQEVSASISLQVDPVPRQERIKVGAPPPPEFRPRSDEEQQDSLATLLRRGRPQPVANTAALVNALWSISDFNDVSLEGQVLHLRTSQIAPGLCDAVGSSVRSASVEIASIEIRAQSGSVVRCSANAVTPFIPPIVRNPGVGAGFAPVAQTTVIDARAAPPFDVRAAQRAIIADAMTQRLKVVALSLREREALVYYNNDHYFSEYDALDRLVRILTQRTPPTVETFKLISLQGAIPQREFVIARGSQERHFFQFNEVDQLSLVESSNPAPLGNPVLSAAEAPLYPRFGWTVFPQFRQQLFDPSNPFAVQFLAAAAGWLEILPGVTLTGQVEATLYDNFNVNRLSDSVLPHVRSDFVKFFSKGKNGIGQLDLAYRFRLAPNVFGIVKAGYLESMFAGAGGEVLWRPEGQRWAIGADLYYVRQRQFDRLLGLQPYGIWTGHVSAYYASPWYGLNFAVSSGQYLAGDRGLSFQVTRRFASGVEIGAFFTKTNVSATDFGEGSFDKGIIIRIPLSWAAPMETQTTLSMDLRPVQRDGGQRLAGDAVLFDETRRTSEAEMMNLVSRPN